MTLSREDDVALARDVLGWTDIRRDRVGVPPGPRRTPFVLEPLPQYATAPTGNSMLALIEGMAVKGYSFWFGSWSEGGYNAAFWAPKAADSDIGVHVQFANIDALPAAVAEAALRATGNWREG